MTTGPTRAPARSRPPRAAASLAATTAVRIPETPLVAIVLVGQRTGRVLLAGPRTVREATAPDLPLRISRSETTHDLVDRLVAALGTAVPASVPVVLAGHPPSVDRASADARLLTLVVATIPGHHEHTAPAILRSHALRVLRRRSPTDHQVGRR